MSLPLCQWKVKVSGELQQLLLWGFHHNISWDARALGFAAAALPAPPPLTGCLQPVPRKAAAPRGEPSLLPPVLEAVCNDSIPGLPGISNFTVYLYCNLFNSSRGSSQRPGDLGAACSDADWYLSGGSAWAWACQEHFPAEFNATVCSNVSLRETPGPQQLLLEELCASLATSPSTFQEPTRANASLAQPLGHPQPGVPARCQDGCWVPHTNYLLRLLDLVLALSELDAAGQAAREPLSEAILLSSLMDNTSFWDSLRANASGGILRAVGRYLGQERRAAAKRELLGCFSAVLWDLLQEDEETPMLEILLQEYLQMPRENLHQLLLSAESEAMQRFLALLHRSWHRLRVDVVRGEALQSLASLLLRRFPHLTPQLFVDLSQFIPFMAVSDIMRFPPALLANETVLAALRMHSTQLTPGQKAAFARRLLQAPFLGAVPTWPLGFLHAALPLLPHLPLSSFLQLTPQQVWGLGDGWQPLRLGLVQGRHVAHSLVNRSREAGPKAAQRLGALACFLSSEELQELASLQDPRGPVEQSLLACAAAGTLPQHGRVMLALADLLRSTNLATVGPGELPVWKGVLPEMGVGFLERLSAAQLDALLPTLQPAQLTRTQASFLLTRAVQRDNAMAGDADRLCPLLPGLGPTSLAAVLALLQRQGCACLGPALPLLSAAQTAALLQALQGPRQEQPLDGWPDCLLPLVPLQLLRPGAQALRGTPRALQLPWSPQQAQLLWREVGAGTNRSHCATGALGSLAVGMSCTALQELRREDFLGALGTLYARPRSLPASLVRRPPVPSCADVRATFPAAWSAAQLAAMDPAQLQRCLGLLSQDPALRPDQLRAVLGQARRVRRDGDGAAARDTGAGLGCAGLGSCAGHGGPCRPWGLAMGPCWPWRLPVGLCWRRHPRLGADALRGEDPAGRPAVASSTGSRVPPTPPAARDGALLPQTQAVVSSFLRQRGVRARDLVLPELVALGHLLCGLRAAEMQSLDAKELSKAAPFLGSLSLRCSEQQMEALAARLTSSAAFGPASAWGPEIFTEIGTLAAGLPDIVLSALVPEQIWALTPQAIAAIPAPKFAVVFGSAQLLTLSSAQASAVTPEQRRRLSSAQRRALASAQYEGEAAQDGQGRSGASPRSGFTLALLFCLPRSCLCAPW
nr:PREDICTED: stereocilin [Apteryx mantelli mantelli]